MALPVVAVVGRPNVGKSTLFNRLIGFQKAVVHDRSGVTRDRLYEEATILDQHRVLLVDTGGIEPDADQDLLVSMRRQSLVAVEEADVILFVVDGKAGLVPADVDVAGILRRSGKAVVVVVNKVDGPGQEDLAADFWQLGLPELVTVSAAHGRGLYELSDAIVRELPPADPRDLAEPGTAIDEAGEEEGPIRIAVVGRPNIGKSTFVNALLGEERHVVDDAPGTTMDPIDSAVNVDGKEYVLVDTAGVRKKAKIEDELERFVSLRAIRAIERCHVTVLMIDGTEGVTDQDAKLAELIVDRGRAMIVLVNKWDLAKGREDLDSKQVAEDLRRYLPHASWAPYLFISAKTGRGMHRVLAKIDEVYAEFDKRIATHRLNTFLLAAVHAHTPPQKSHHPVRLLYMSQTRVRPPTFAFFCNTPEGVGPSYRRYLTNRLREEFGFEGTPLRTQFRKKRKSTDEDAGEGTGPAEEVEDVPSEVDDEDSLG